MAALAMSLVLCEMREPAHPMHPENPPVASKKGILLERNLGGGSG
jgi:hypothetical protein